MLEHGVPSTTTNTACRAQERSRCTSPTCSNPVPGRRPRTTGQEPRPLSHPPTGTAVAAARLALSPLPCCLQPEQRGARIAACHVGHSPSLCWGSQGGCNTFGYLVLGICWARAWGEHRSRRGDLQHRSSHLAPGDLPALGSGTWGQCERGKGVRLCSQAHLCAA